MAVTVHDTFFIKTMIRYLAIAFLRLSGWKAEGERPNIPKYVIIAAPHTSNWDFVYTLCLALVFRIKPLIMMKDAMFRWPLGPFFMWLGARPIDRSKSNNVVSQSVQSFHRQKEMVMVVPPSGTRKKVSYWKTGFYHIANGANVPVVLGYLDYRRKAGGIGPIVEPTGDIDADMRVIRKFYVNVSGKYPKKALGLMLPVNSRSTA